MNGIIIVNKETGFTSHDVVNKIRRIFNTKKVGHLGTLDPSATGVLLVCLNEATKLIQFIDNDKKEYVAKILIGKKSDTYDLDGTIIEERRVNEISINDIDNTLSSFIGEAYQIPPKYSSIKVNGRKLYEYARNNQEVEIASRKITIYELERTSSLIYSNGTLEFEFRVVVSKGTYIRSLCVDIAEKLGYPGLMKSLVRTSCGKYTIDEASKLSDIENGNYKLISMKEALSFVPAIDKEEFVFKALNGMKISLNQVKEALSFIPKIVAFFSSDKLIAIYRYNEEKNVYEAARVWK